MSDKTSAKYITIIRGEDQIGGSIVDIHSDTTRVLVDVGLELDDVDEKESIKYIDEILSKHKYDAIIISHNHLDHYGLLNYIDWDKYDIPIYMGEKAYGVLKVMQKYRKTFSNFDCWSITDYLIDSKKFSVGDINITPFLVDHSAFDAYSLFLEIGDTKIFYSGDFRDNGRKNFSSYLERIPKEVDVLICEGTTLRSIKETDDNASIKKTHPRNMTENQLENKAVEIMTRYEGPVFIMQAGTNIDRLVSMYKASKRSGRIFLEELYNAMIAKELAKTSTIPNPDGFNDVYAFTSTPLDENLHSELSKFNNITGKNLKEIKTGKFTMLIRQSMARYISNLKTDGVNNFKDGVLIYSMWDGYKDQPKMKEFLRNMEDLGLTVENLHTSGHADVTAIEKLLRQIKHKELLPIHTENGEYLKKIDRAY